MFFQYNDLSRRNCSYDTEVIRNKHSTLLRKFQRKIFRIKTKSESIFFNREDWAIGILTCKSLGDLQRVHVERRPILTRADVTDADALFVADPFLCRRADRWWLFFEVMNAETDRGEIACAVSDDRVSWQYLGLVLRPPFHVSYPFVFEMDGECYMLPEMWENGSTCLYRAKSFPFEWEPVVSLTEHPVADPTIFQHNGYWYMLAETAPDSTYDCLRLYYGRDLSGPLAEHPCSPLVVGDPNHARPAGRVIVHGNRLIRLSQGCWPEYGRCVYAHEIIELTPNTFSEHALGQKPILGPGRAPWCRFGMHHLDLHADPSGEGWLGCVDGR